jgi:hypothetical protein
MVTYSLWMPAPASVFYLAAGACVAQAGGGRQRVLKSGRWAIALLAAAAVAAGAVLFWLPVQRKTAHTQQMLSALKGRDLEAAFAHARAAADADRLDPRPAADAADVGMMYARALVRRKESIGPAVVPAIELVNEAIRRDRRNHVYRRLAGSIMWRLEIPPGDPYERLVARGDRAFLAGDPDGARALWADAEKFRRRSLAIQKVCGAYFQAVRLNGRDSRLRIEAARVFCDGGYPERALEQLDEADRIDAALFPDSAQKLQPNDRRQIYILRARAKVLVELDRRPEPETQPVGGDPQPQTEGPP